MGDLRDRLVHRDDDAEYLQGDREGLRDTRGILRPLLEGLAINPDVASGLDLVRRALSTPQLEQARETDLDLRAKTPEESRR